jgi:hypothetical protein
MEKPLLWSSNVALPAIAGILLIVSLMSLGRSYRHPPTNVALRGSGWWVTSWNGRVAVVSYRTSPGGGDSICISTPDIGDARSSALSVVWVRMSRLPNGGSRSAQRALVVVQPSSLANAFGFALAGGGFGMNDVKVISTPWWFIAVTLALVAVIPPMLRQRLRATRRAHGRCTRCGYDIRGLSIRCPECGEPIKFARHVFGQ